jgi:hypothetical protein
MRLKERGTQIVGVEDGFKALERIVIERSDGHAQFVLQKTGAPFFVTGFNYVRLRAADAETYPDHSTFDAKTELTEADYDPDRAEAMFRTLSESGYNTVRVFIIGRSAHNPGVSGNYASTAGLYEAYMQNVLDFLRRATRHGIRVFPTMGDGEVPMNAFYCDRFAKYGGEGKMKNRNIFVLTKGGVDARVEYISAFLSYLKDKEPAVLPTLLGVQCQNEACLEADHWPFTESEGSFAAANGKTYDLSSTEERQALMDDGYRYYHQRIVDAVKAVDPELLIAEGVFVPRAVGKDGVHEIGVWPGKVSDERYPPTLTDIGTGALDFLDVHFYRDRDSDTVDEAFRLNLGSSGFFSEEMADIRKSMPLIIGEFGAFSHMEESFTEAVVNMVRIRDLALNEKVNGMLYWTYDCLEQKDLYHAADNWSLFHEKMGTFGPK